MKGICPKCGAIYYGWALQDPLKRKCEKCGSTLKMMENGVPIRLSAIAVISPELKTERPKQ